jgi:hypothetical protein
MPAGWTYQGCWIDNANGGRIFPYQIPDSQENSQEWCAQQCFDLGYNISGTEFAVQCMCGNYLQYGAAKTLESDCSQNCPANAKEKCGTGNRANIWSNGVPKVYAPPKVQKTGLGNWAYQGCAQDNVNDKRTFFWQIYFPNIMVPQTCLDRCAEFGYMAAGLEYGKECYCGDPQNMVTANATFVAESECQIICDGDPSIYCGGGSRLTTYFWTGTPFYSWSFPQDPSQAGQYKFLIMGKNTPLMTMQSITGKVTFLSKGPGTTRGNETGAYELDLSLVETDPEHAWRALHLKTDVFCAAGVILPDKVGRQMTVGGWNFDSTFGMRLYWPDGSAGVNGTNDWQENRDELHLQVSTSIS